MIPSSFKLQVHSNLLGFFCGVHFPPVNKEPNKAPLLPSGKFNLGKGKKKKKLFKEMVGFAKGQDSVHAMGWALEYGSGIWVASSAA